MAQGTIEIKWRSDIPYSAYAENKYIVELGNFARCYYNYSDYKFYWQIYNGSNWTTVSVTSAVQSFVAGTTIHLLLSYDKTVGVRLTVNGISTNTDITWTEQSLPTSMYLGSSSSLVNQCDGVLKNLVTYNRMVSAKEAANLYAMEA